MNDLIVLESVIAVLLLVYIARPFVRKFRGVDGLSALPGISLLLLIAVFPAFGFRPELIPLSLFALFAFLGSIPRLVDIARRLRTDDYGEKQAPFALAVFVLLAGSYAFAVVFAPGRLQAPVMAAVGSTISVRDESRGVALELLIGVSVADSSNGPRPLVVFGPPVLGSMGMTDTYRAELTAKGYAVVSFCRPGLDFPAAGEGGRVRYPRLGFAVDAIVSTVWGRDLAFAAEAGARIEHERSADLRFVVDHLLSKIAAGDEPYKNMDGSRVSIVGYGASGAAALMYAADADPSRIRSIVAIEPPVHSYLSVEPKVVDEPSEHKSAKMDSTIYGSVVGLFAWIKKTLTARAVYGPLRGNEAERAVAVPTMILVSDWIRDVAKRDKRYATLVPIKNFSSAPCWIVSAAGAGPAHYSDVLSDYPVYAFFAQGLDRFIPRNTPFAPQAAALSASFIEGTLTDGGSGILIEKNK